MAGNVEEAPDHGFLRDPRANLPVYTMLAQLRGPTCNKLEAGEPYSYHWVEAGYGWGGGRRLGSLDHAVNEFERTPEFTAYLAAYSGLTNTRVEWTQALAKYMFFTSHPEVIPRQITRIGNKLAKARLDVVGATNKGCAEDVLARLAGIVAFWEHEMELVQEKLAVSRAQLIELRERIDAAWEVAEATYQVMMETATAFVAEKQRELNDA